MRNRLALAMILALSAGAQESSVQARARIKAAIELERRSAIQPDLARVEEAARSPETLWAFVIDPATPYDDRMAAAERAALTLPPSYLAKKIAAEEELRRESWSHDWWRPVPKSPQHTSRPAGETITILGVRWETPAGPIDPPTTIEALRRMPWPWQVQQALVRDVRVSTGNARGYDVVRDLPCTSELEETVIRHTLTSFPMTAESYGVLGNIALKHRGQTWMSFGDVGYARGEEEHWWATQALVVSLADRDPDIIDKLIPIVSNMRNGIRGHASGTSTNALPRKEWGPVPWTAFLALADRIDEGVVRGEHEWRLAFQAIRLVQALDDPPFAIDRQVDVDVLGIFHRWLEDHRSELEAKAAAEREAIAAATARMQAVTLCR